MPNSKQIFERYISGMCSPHEKQLVEDWLDDLDINVDGVSEDIIDMHLRSLDYKMGYRRKNKIHNIYLRIAQVAAALVLIIGVSYYYNNSNNRNAHTLVLEDIKAPKSSNALVILENGKEYDLDELSYGDTIRALGYKITKQPNGELRYINNETSGKVFYNTLRTKSGGTAQVVLSDGSRVWLNANSEIKYPIIFNSKERRVELIGEGYFEITSAQDIKRMPFYVSGKNITVKVYGTKFNVNLYNQSPSVALLEGSVGISSNSVNSQDLNESMFTTKLNPNQYFDGKDVHQSNNIERFIDWKDGYFDLNEINLFELGDKIENWYGIQVSVDPSLKNRKLYGRLDRKKDLADMIEIISNATSINYKFSNNLLEIKSN